MKFHSLIPELTVKDIKRTREFYVGALGFQVEYERSDDQFLFLSYEGSQMMFEQYHEDGWNIGVLEYPFGRGVNFSLQTAKIEELYEKVVECGIPLYRTMKEVTYETGETQVVQKEFLIQDPDGYLLRFTKESLA